MAGEKIFTKLEQRAKDPDTAATELASPFKNADEALEHATMSILQHYYPGHPWLIMAHHHQGVVMFKLEYLMGQTDWIVIPLRLAKNHDVYRATLMRQAGLILEKFALPRAGFNATQFLTALRAIPKHRRGTYGAVIPV